MEDQDQENQDQDQNQEGEELLKMIGAEEERQEEKGNQNPSSTPSPLLSLTEISCLTGIMYVTLKRYAVVHDSQELAGLWEGEGRNKKYHPEAVEVFRRLKAEGKRGRPRGGAGGPGRGGVADPLPPVIPTPSKKGGKKKVAGGKKGAGKRAGKPPAPESARSPIPASLATQEADRAMAAIERVQLVARYEAVKEMVGTWVWELERLEKVLGLGNDERLLGTLFKTP